MAWLRRLPALLSVLLLGALELRLGVDPALAVCLTLALLVLLALPQPGARQALAGVLGLGGALWLAVAVVRVQARLAAGEPWVRLVLILAAVAAFTAWSAWLLRPGKTGNN